MASKDYYEVLGVTRDATPDQIRKAYRALARKYHPDVNKAPEAQAKFNEIQNAYDVLSDERTRKLYDHHGEAGVKAGAAPGGGGYTSQQAWRHATGVGGVDFDSDDLGSVFESIFGAKGRHGPRPRRGPAQRAPEPPPATHEISVSFMTAARGGTEHLRLDDTDRSRTIEVTIPPGTDDGTTLRMRKVVGSRGAERDLLLTIHVGAHPLFRRGEHSETGRGLDLYIDVPLTIAEATLGAQIAIPTLDGSVEVAFPPGTASGRRLRCRGLGLKDSHGRQGDLYAIVKIVPPPADALSDAERRALQDAAAKGPAPRAASEWPGASPRPA